MSVKFNNSYKGQYVAGRLEEQPYGTLAYLYLIFILFFILCESTLQCRKMSHSETFEKFQCKKFNEFFTPRKFHEIYHNCSQLLSAH